MQYSWQASQCESERQLQDRLNWYEEEDWEIFSVLHGAAPQLFFIVARKPLHAAKGVDSLATGFCDECD
jgi:hypothetical protein